MPAGAETMSPIALWRQGGLGQRPQIDLFLKRPSWPIAIEMIGRN
jgi:hypothetical protein